MKAIKGKKIKKAMKKKITTEIHEGNVKNEKQSEKKIVRKRMKQG